MRSRLSRLTPFRLIVLAALAAGALTRLILRNGINASPDSWAYWEGSVSLIEGGGYARLLGEPIVDWPPLFSIYLALFQLGLDQTGAALVWAITVASVLNVIAWGTYLKRLFDDEDNGRPSLGFAGSVAFLTLFVPLCTRWLLAQFLMLAAVGAGYATLLGALRATRDRALYWQSLGLAGLLGIALFAHNSALVFVGAAVVLLLVAAHAPLRTRAIAAGLVGVVSVMPWLWGRWWLGQLDSHLLAEPLRSPGDYVIQTLTGLGEFFVPAVAGHLPLRAAAGLTGIAVVLVTAGLAIFRRRLSLPAAPFAAILATALSGLFVFLLFNLTFVDSRLSGRFLWFVPLTLVPVWLRAARASRLTGSVLLVAVLAMPAVRIATLVVTGVLPTTGAARPEDVGIRPDYFLTTTHPERRPPHARQVIPPSYPWMERWHRSSRPEAERQTVRILSPEE